MFNKCEGPHTPLAAINDSHSRVASPCQLGIIIMPGDSRRDVGAASPRVAPGLRAGRRIDWSSENEPKMLEQLLGMPHRQLFDPKFGSPIYAGVPLDFSRHRCPVQVDGNIDINKLFDQAPRSRILIERGLVSDSVLNGP